MLNSAITSPLYGLRETGKNRKGAKDTEDAKKIQRDKDKENKFMSRRFSSKTTQFERETRWWQALACTREVG